MERSIKITRKTKETDISAVLDFSGPLEIDISTQLSFFDHLLHGMCFHGGFGLDLKASGDIQIDPHHLVEDVGLVLGEAFTELVARFGAVKRFGHAVIPMDEALSEVVIDAGGRPFCVFNAEFPQGSIGPFDLCLVREFIQALASAGRMNIHASCRNGWNSHHMAEALFKALGIALFQSFRQTGSGHTLSTKGDIQG